MQKFGNNALKKCKFTTGLH